MINHGRINTGTLAYTLGAVSFAKIPVADDRNQIVVAVDVSNWLRPDVECSPERAFCHTYARNGQVQMVPGGAHSYVAAGISCHLVGRAVGPGAAASG